MKNEEREMKNEQWASGHSSFFISRFSFFTLARLESGATTAANLGCAVGGQGPRGSRGSRACGAKVFTTLADQG
jgi:hypothetical protein